MSAPETARVDFSPWLYWQDADPAEQTAQQQRHKELEARGGIEVGERCFVSTLAMVDPDTLRLGADSYIAAHAYVTGEIETGEHCTVNPFAVVRGTVRLGNGVRIGAHSSLIGFNHSIDPAEPVYRQPLTVRGITVGDDVWIGSNVVVLDGVTVGEHSVLAAGAVVTRDVPPWSIMGGNPARRLRDRREPSRGGAPRAADLPGRLERFADTARAQLPALLERSWDAGAPDGRFLDRPGALPTVRAYCDAIELSELLLGVPPAQLPPGEHVRRLREAQDPRTGLVPPIGAAGVPEPLPGGFGPHDAQYHVLCVGYALDLLGSGFAHPVHAVAGMTPAELVTALGALPWDTVAWSSGAWVDAWATAAHWNLGLGEPGQPGALEALYGWLLTRVDPWSGMWGSPSAAEGRRQVVNGYYRLTRGSFAQFGLPVPHPERVVDTTLDHAADARYFGPGREDACSVLDVAHPLWLCRLQTGHRAAEVQAWAGQQLDRLLPRWGPDLGLGFATGPHPARPGSTAEPGLQGTEMWLAIAWLLADLVGAAEALAYRPRGVHRPEPARTLPGL